MYRTTFVCCFLVATLAGLSGCSGSKPADDSKKKSAIALDKIQGQAQVLLTETSAQDEALNAGGPSVYLIDGLHRYRLFFNKPFTVDAGKEYAAEGILAQKAIDSIGDPDQGKNGYPLQSSCDAIVRSAWPGQAFDVTDANSNALCAKVKRYPARPVFLVKKIEAVAEKDAKKAEKELPEVTVPAEKQAAALKAGQTTLPAPMWALDATTVKCKVIIGGDGKIAELESGAQLCETVPWETFQYEPATKGGKPAQVSTEVEIKFEPRK